MNRSFSLDDTQLSQLRAWYKEHDKVCAYVLNQGAVGGRFTYSFTPNSLFRVDEVTCACGAKIDLTDYDSV